MRREDREVLDTNEIFDILIRCDTVRIGIHGEKYPYIVPVSFGAEMVNGKPVVYFHCARQGIKERVRRLEKLGMMTDRGCAVLPPMGPRSFKMDHDIESAMKKARVWSKFRSFPPLYQRIRAYNVAFYKKQNPEMYEKTLQHLIEETKAGRMFGEWNDYGRLLNY